MRLIWGQLARYVRLSSALVLLLLVVGSAAAPTPGWAHNREKGSDPANGAILDVAPSKVTFRFKTAVGKDSITVLLIEPSGSRVKLEILSAGQLEVIAKLPPMVDGLFTARWKLISSDGHAVTNKVTFTVATGTSASLPTAASGASTQVPSPGTPATVALPAGTVAAAAPLATSVPAPSVRTAAVPVTPLSPALSQTALLAAIDKFNDVGGAPNWLRWLLRFGSYAAMFVIVGIAATASFIWPDLLKRVALRRALVSSALVVTILATLQLLVLAIDIDAGSWFASLRRIGSFDVGIGLLARIVLALVAVTFVTLLGRSSVHIHRISQGLLALSIGLFASWSYVGHAQSQRWAWLGMPVDIAHHAAGATWVGALAIVGFLALKQVDHIEGAHIVQRLSSTAFIAVLVVVATGLVQSVRLVGRPANLFDPGHSRFLVVKVAIVGLMLFFGNRNRQETAKLAAAEGPVGEPVINYFRRRIAAEFVLGVVVIAVTSSLVVRPPAIAAEALPRSLQNLSQTSIQNLYQNP